MRIIAGAVLLVLMSFPVFAADSTQADEQKILYAIGLDMARRLTVFNLAPGEFDQVRKGLVDGITGKTPVRDSEEYLGRIRDLAVSRRDGAGSRADDAVKAGGGKLFYALGLDMARRHTVFHFSPEEFKVVNEGLMAGVSGKTPFAEAAKSEQGIFDLATARRKANGEKLASISGEYLDAAARVPGAVRTASGLVYLALREGTGPKPAASDTVKVNYRGTLVDGTEFYTTYTHPQPEEVKLTSEIKCWEEGIEMMKVGGKARLVCPPGIAYGKETLGGRIPVNATVTFEVELLDIRK